MFHAFTGCDTVSSFDGRGKKTAWDTWMTFDDAEEGWKQARPSLHTDHADWVRHHLAEGASPHEGGLTRDGVVTQKK